MLIANAQSNELISWSSIMGGPLAIPIIAISAISNPPSPKCKSCIALGEKKMEFPFYWLDDAELCELMSFTHKSFFLLSFHAKSLVVRGFTAYLSFRRVQGWQLAGKRMVVIWDINTSFK